MKFQFLFLILFLKTSFLFSQNEYQKSADSLQAIINEETTDSNKLKPYIALCNLYKKYSKTKFIACNEQLLHILQKTKSTKDYCFYYQNKALICSENDNNREATIYAAKANILFYENKDWDNYILNCVDYAKCLSINDEILKATAVLQKALTIAKNTKSKNIASVYYGFCYLYNGISDYIIALEYAKKAIALEKNTTNKAKIYYIIANIYNSLGNFKNALEYNEFASRNCNTPYLSNKYKFLKAKILFNMEHYQEALAITIDYKEYCKKNSYVARYYDAVIFISDCYFKLKKYHLSNEYIDESLKFNFDRRNMQIGIKTRKAKIGLALNNIKTSKKYIDEALSLLKDEDFFEQKIAVYNIKSKLEEALGNYKIALHFNNKVAAVKDANTANFNKNKLQQLQVDLDVTEKNNSIRNLQITQLKKQAEINKKNKYLIYFFCALLFCFLGLFFFLYTYNIIKIKNSIIGSTNVKLAEESNKIQKSLQEKETLLKEIHHRVKNNLQLVMSLLNIQAQKANQSVAGFLAVSKSRILSMALIHENLYQSENLSNVNFKDYVQNLTQTILNAYDNTITDIDLQIEIEEMYFDIQTAIPLGLIINELVNNAYKHAFVNIPTGIITLKLHQKEDQFELLIGDNGTGIRKKVNAKKTLGLQLVEELVFQIDGQLRMENNNGMHYYITFQNTKLLNNSTYE